MTTMKQVVKSMTLVALGLALAVGAAHAAVQPLSKECVQKDNGTGTVTLPPEGCDYLSPDQVHLIIAGLPQGTTIILGARHTDFICRKLGQCGTPGGPLGGEVENFGSAAVFQVSGTGLLAGWNRTLKVPLQVQTATGKRTPGDPVQSFDTEMQALQGSITGDPDFDLFEVVGGTLNGYKSPGKTTLTKQDDGSFKVDSSFTVGYQIRFRGATGGRLEGYEGKTEGSVTMKAVQPCTDADCPCQ